jgi:hypothetical protein
VSEEQRFGAGQRKGVAECNSDRGAWKSVLAMVPEETNRMPMEAMRTKYFRRRVLTTPRASQTSQIRPCNARKPSRLNSRAHADWLDPAGPPIGTSIRQLVDLLPAVRQPTTTVSRIENGKKKVPAGGSHVGTKVGVWEVSPSHRIRRLSARDPTHRKFFWQIFLAKRFGKFFGEFSAAAFAAMVRRARIRRHLTASRRIAHY